MKFAIALLVAVAALEATLGAAQAAHLRFERGKLVVAQSYCGMCADARTACVLKCNGAGACIQRCDEDYLACREQNCGRR